MVTARLVADMASASPKVETGTDLRMSPAEAGSGISEPIHTLVNSCTLTRPGEWFTENKDAPRVLADLVHKMESNSIWRAALSSGDAEDGVPAAPTPAAAVKVMLQIAYAPHIPGAGMIMSRALKPRSGDEVDRGYAAGKNAYAFYWLASQWTGEKTLDAFIRPVSTLLRETPDTAFGAYREALAQKVARATFTMDRLTDAIAATTMKPGMGTIAYNSTEHKWEVTALQNGASGEACRRLNAGVAIQLAAAQAKEGNKIVSRLGEVVTNGLIAIMNTVKQSCQEQANTVEDQLTKVVNALHAIADFNAASIYNSAQGLNEYRKFANAVTTANIVGASKEDSSVRAGGGAVHPGHMAAHAAIHLGDASMMALLDASHVPLTQEQKAGVSMAYAQAASCLDDGESPETMVSQFVQLVKNNPELGEAALAALKRHGFSLPSK